MFVDKIGSVYSFKRNEDYLAANEPRSLYSTEMALVFVLHANKIKDIRMSTTHFRSHSDTSLNGKVN